MWERTVKLSCCELGLEEARKASLRGSLPENYDSLLSYIMIIIDTPNVYLSSLAHSYLYPLPKSKSPNLSITSNIKDKDA